MGKPPPSAYPRRLGRAMVYLAWLLVLGLLTLFFSDWQDRQDNPNRRYASEVTAGGMREITLLRNRYGHYVANGKINDQGVVFMVDTGATMVSVPAPVARRLGLKAGAPYRVSTANGSTTVYATRLTSLRLGAIVLHRVRADINPAMDGDEVLLGMNVLKHLELIQRGDRLTLRQHTVQ